MTKIIFKVALAAFITTYIYAMLIHPLYYDLSLRHLMRTWHEWQSFNVGMLALLSSIFFYFGAVHREREREKHEHIANTSTMPHEFANIIGYLRKTFHWLDNRWDSINNTFDCETKIKARPLPAPSYTQTFKDCIKYASIDEKDYLTSLLMKIQILDSRLNELENHLEKGEKNDCNWRAISCIYLCIKIYCDIIGNYQHYRKLEKFNSKHFNIENFEIAQEQLKIDIEKYTYNYSSIISLKKQFIHKGRSAIFQ